MRSRDSCQRARENSGNGRNAEESPSTKRCPRKSCGEEEQRPGERDGQARGRPGARRVASREELARRVLALRPGAGGARPACSCHRPRSREGCVACPRARPPVHAGGVGDAQGATSGRRSQGTFRGAGAWTTASGPDKVPHSVAGPRSGRLPGVMRGGAAASARVHRAGHADPAEEQPGGQMKISITRDFPRTFWTANVMELFERAAYYGLKSVLAIYLTGSRRRAAGWASPSRRSASCRASSTPRPTSPDPRRRAGRPLRLPAHAALRLLAARHRLLRRRATCRPTRWCSWRCCVMATGAGLFKPIISGTIARTTDERTSAIGFGIYYWMINLGAFLAPLVVSCAQGLLLAGGLHRLGGLHRRRCCCRRIFFFRDPPLPENRKTLQGGPGRRGRGAGRRALRADDRRLLGLLGPLLPELRLGALVPARLRRPRAGERRGHVAGSPRSACR